MPEKSVCPVPKEVEGRSGEYTQCPHGMCLNHHPEWKPMTAVLCMEVPFGSGVHKVWFDASGSEIPFTVNCCESIMRRFVEVYEKRCEKCGRVGYDVRRYVLRCMCCGYTKTAAEGSDRRFKSVATDGSLMAMLEPEKMPIPGPPSETAKPKPPTGSEKTKKKKWWQFGS